MDKEIIGLKVTDPKRRITEETNSTGPKLNDEMEDENMTDPQENNSSDPKNLLMAGSALQARQSL